jgi:hypothetical protein
MLTPENKLTSSLSSSTAKLDKFTSHSKRQMDFLYKWCDGGACDSKGMWMDLDINFEKYRVISTASKNSWALAQCTVKQT